MIGSVATRNRDGRTEMTVTQDVTFSRHLRHTE